MASHGLGELRSRDDKPWLTHGRGGVVPEVVTTLFGPANWALDAKCDGGTRSKTRHCNIDKKK